MTSDTSLVKLRVEFDDLLDSLDALEARNLVAQAIDAAKNISISSLWEEPDLAVSYWILLLSGTNQEDELEIAKELLVWKTFGVMDSAKILCIPQSNRKYFKHCARRFGAVKTPCLTLSGSPDMYESVTVDPSLLFALREKPGAFQRFLTELHSLLEGKKSIRQIDLHLKSDQFWRGLKIVYTELKGLVTLKLGT